MAESLSTPSLWTVEAMPGERRIVIDWQRADEVLGSLMTTYEAHGFPYNQDTVRLPQDPQHMPKKMPRGGTEHAMFLFNLCYYMRGGIKSVDATKMLANVYDDQPAAFVAETAAAMDPAAVGQLVQSHGLGFQHDLIGKHWVKNAQRLQDRWQADPRNIYAGVSNYEESLARIKNDCKGNGFYGFQEKMVSMLTYYLMDDDLIESYVFPLPVDVHVMRVSIATEMLKFIGYEENENLLSQESLAMARELYYQYALWRRVNPLRLCDAVWLLSSALCGKQPGNVTLEPEGKQNRNGRDTVLEPLPIDFRDPAQSLAWYKSCDSCPINDKCLWNVPAKSYYIQGELKRRGLRVHFPRDRLFKLGDL